MATVKLSIRWESQEDQQTFESAFNLEPSRSNYTETEVPLESVQEILENLIFVHGQNPVLRSNY